jgi:hypothetical protein
VPAAIFEWPPTAMCLHEADRLGLCQHASQRYSSRPGHRYAGQSGPIHFAVEVFRLAFPCGASNCGCNRRDDYEEGEYEERCCFDPQPHCLRALALKHNQHKFWHPRYGHQPPKWRLVPVFLLTRQKRQVPLKTSRSDYGQLDAVMKNPIPRLSLFVLKRSIPVRAPLSIKSHAAVLPTKIGLESFFKTACGSPARHQSEIWK